MQVKNFSRKGGISFPLDPSLVRQKHFSFAVICRIILGRRRCSLADPPLVSAFFSEQFEYLHTLQPIFIAHCNLFLSVSVSVSVSRSVNKPYNLPDTVVGSPVRVWIQHGLHNSLGQIRGLQTKGQGHFNTGSKILSPRMRVFTRSLAAKLHKHQVKFLSASYSSFIHT